MPVLMPSDVENSSIELDSRPALREAPTVCGDESGAGATAASAGDPGAALPHSQPNVAAVTDRGNADIRPLWKQRVIFEDRPEGGEVDGFDIVHKEGRVRVAEIGADRGRERAESQLDALGVHGPAQRDLSPARTHRSHIHRDAPIRQGFGFEQAGDRLDSYARFAGL